MFLKVMGFSLMELMLTVLVAGIILSVGLPLLANTGARARQTIQWPGHLAHLYTELELKWPV